MEDFVAGAAAGISGLLIGHPMEVMKIQLQLSVVSDSLGSGGIRSAVLAMMNKGLSQGVYRGLALPLASFTTINSVFFGVYGHTLSWLDTLQPDCRHANLVLAGMAGGAAQMPLVAPVEVVKTAMQAQLTRCPNSTKFFTGPIDCAISIAKRDGLRGLNRGFWLTFVRDVPSYGLYMLIYDWLEKLLSYHVTGSATATLLAGGLAGSFSWLSILPIDTVKSNLQADAAGAKERRSGTEVAKQLYRKHGIRGFYRGGLVVAVRSFPVNAVTFFVWSRTLQLMKGSQ